MNPRIVWHKKRVISRCDRDGALPSQPQTPGSVAQDGRTAHFSNIVTRLEGKRRQMVERLVERTLTDGAWNAGNAAERTRHTVGPILDGTDNARGL